MIEIWGVRGKNKEAFNKVFKTAAAVNGWLANNHRVVVHGVSSPEGQSWSTEGQEILTMADWRNANLDPEHGCGHMQGRGAA